MTPYQQAILNVVQHVPPGMVVSYGQVAAYVGTPRAAREVGWAMRGMKPVGDFPWWRVLNNAGKITIKGHVHATAQQQKELLEAEGVVISADYELDIERYRFRPGAGLLASFRLEPEYIAKLQVKYDLG